MLIPFFFFFPVRHSLKRAAVTILPLLPFFLDPFFPPSPPSPPPFVVGERR